MVVLLQRSHLF